jgi:YD repeat-containing protein
MRFTEEGPRGSNVSEGRICVVGSSLHIYNAAGQLTQVIEMPRKQWQLLYHAIGDMLGKR